MDYYDDDQMLMLSGIQHYMFCPRQWALIHIEQQWDENRLTAEGQLLHQNVDNPAYRQKNGDNNIPEAALFYHETRHREVVTIDEHLRYVTTPEAYLSKDGLNVVVSVDKEEKFRIPIMNVESIVTFGYMGASPGLMKLCMDKVRGVATTVFQTVTNRRQYKPN
jgi:hypothetical protein